MWNENSTNYVKKIGEIPKVHVSSKNQTNIKETY